MGFVFFFFKQKTAYEMRISDWSSDVCSSDLAFVFEADPRFGQLGIACDLRIGKGGKQAGGVGFAICAPLRGLRLECDELRPWREIGRASCRERVCQYV